MAMFSTNVWPRQTLPVLLLGALTTAIGNTVMIFAIDMDKTSVIYGMMALMGHGIGMRMVPSSMHSLAYFPTQTAVISFLNSFAFPFGGTLALTLMSTVFNNKSGVDHRDPKQGVRYAFIALVPFMWSAVVLALFLGNVWILKDGAHEVTNGVHLWSLLTGKKLARERRTRGDKLGDNNVDTQTADVTEDNVAASKQKPEAV